MGGVNCCRKTDPEEEKNLERAYLYSALKKSIQYKNPDINILSEQPDLMKVNTKENYINEKKNNDSKNLIVIKESENGNIDEDLIKEKKAKKIQKTYRSYHLKNKFNAEIKPIISKKTNTFIEQFYQQCSQGGDTTPDDDFNPDGWKEYYPSDERFFLYKKGNTFQNQIRIKNADDPDNLEIYEGETNLENLKHGFGTLTTPHCKLKGTWRNDQFTGWGRKSMRNGDVLEGKFVNGELNGKGIFKSKENSVYIGDFVNSERNGKGELTTDRFHYEGDFKDNQLNGNGIIDFNSEGYRYEGQFENNEITGKGICKWENGDIYEGPVKNGIIEGYGKYTYSDGKIYEGEYINGIKQGRGKLIYPSNKMYEGIFKDGLPDGEGFYSEDGHTSKVLFSHGNFVKLIA